MIKNNISLSSRKIQCFWSEVKLKHIMSVDVEEWYQGEFTRSDVQIKLKTNVLESLINIIDLFNTYKVKATFFIVGETLLRYPESVEIILSSGHELGFHGWDHRPLNYIGPSEFAEDLKRFQKIMSEWDYFPTTFRAPSASLENKTSWALGKLFDAGYTCDSSIFPCWTPLYGISGAPIFPYWPRKDEISFPTEFSESWKILEFPFLAFGPRIFRLPMGTGFYLRSLPLWVYKWALNKRDNQRLPAVISFHNWEFSKDVPKTKLSLRSNLYLNYNLSNCKFHLEELLKNYTFISINSVAKSIRMDSLE